MKYKELYLNAQVRFAKKLGEVDTVFGDIRNDAIRAANIIEYRKDEISPELLNDIRDYLRKVETTCFFYIHNKT